MENNIPDHLKDNIFAPYNARKEDESRGGIMDEIIDFLNPRDIEDDEFYDNRTFGDGDSWDDLEDDLLN